MGPLDLPRVNQGLTILVGLMAAWCAARLFMWPRVDHLLAKAGPATPLFLTPPLEGLRPLDEYLSVVARQDPFRIGERGAQSASLEPSRPAAQDAQTLLSDLKLVGIAFGEEPVAMIEHQQQTQFLKVGDAINGLTIKEILKDRVILRTGDRDVELF